MLFVFQFDEGSFLKYLILFFSAAYPSAIPEISIRSESITEENILDLQQQLKAFAKGLTGQCMIKKIVEEAEIQLYALGLKPGKASGLKTQTDNGKKQKKTKKPKRKFKSEDEVDDNQKLPSMKTADDVVKRIIWDDNLEKDDFIVGYFDRFRGLVEKCFSSFSWEDLAAVDYDVLAVPKHRIQYFKYKNVKVWDKSKRIDNVFGSAEGTKTIDVVIKEVEELESLQRATGVYTQLATSSEDEDSSDDSDDDNITVSIGQSANIGIKSPQKQDYSDQQAEKINEASNGFNPYWRDKLRPNYFVCARVRNEAILDKIGNIQDFLMEQEPLFSECCIPGVSLHVTLNTLGLDTNDQLLHCIEVLKKIKPDLESALPKSSLKLHGVSNFYNRVIYAKVNFEKDFLDFCTLLKTLLTEGGIQIRDGYEFVPHVTIMKTTRPVSRARGSKNVSSSLYAKFVDTDFGEQNIDSIYLCAMGDERRPDGFYVTPAELHFNSIS